MKKVTLLAVMAAVVGCSVIQKKAEPLRVNVVPIIRRNIEVYADASGNIEPVSITDIKSKASGQVIKLNVQTGVLVNPGDTLVQLDTKEVDQQVFQAELDTLYAYTSLQSDRRERERQDSLFAAKAITKKDWEAGQLTITKSENNLAKMRSAWDAAKQRQSDATVVAAYRGTIIGLSVSLGQIVTSSTTGASQGTTLLAMTDLTQLRVRASFNEVDIANIDTGMTATIKVDAYPDEDILGRIAKIEPTAITNSGVTMFPVIITIDNSDGRLKPGMNGSISVWVERREGVIAVPNEAIRQTTEVPFLSQVLASITGVAVNPDSLKANVDSQIARLGRTGFDPSAPVGDAGANGGGFGEVDMSIDGFEQRGGGGAGGGQRGGGGAGGGQRGARGNQPGRGRGNPTEEQCAPVKAAIAKSAANQKAYNGLIAQLRENVVDRAKVNTDLRALYSKAGTDTALGRRCQSRELGFGGGRAGGGRAGGGGGRGAAGGGPTSFGPGRNRPTPTRNGLVFVVPAPGQYEPRVIRLGLGSYEYTEVVEGLREGEEVAILSAAIIALQQAQSRDRTKQNLSAGNALMGGNTKMGGGGGRGGGGGGGRRGGGG